VRSENNNGWYVYIIRCDDDSLYTGITTNMVRRWCEHQQSKGQRSEQCKMMVPATLNISRDVFRKSNRGAKFFRARKPIQLVYIESNHNRSSATRREAVIKRLSRAAKLQLLTMDHNELHILDRALLPSAVSELEPDCD
jgi:putative endonuclease